MRTGLDFGRRQFAPATFRVTVTSFNLRARRVVESLGFRPAGSFLARWMCASVGAGAYRSAHPSARRGQAPPPPSPVTNLLNVRFNNT